MKKCNFIKVMLLMLVLAFPMSASAKELKYERPEQSCVTPSKIEHQAYINPLYENVVDESDLNKLPETKTTAKTVEALEEEIVEYWVDILDAAADMREQLVARKELIEVHIYVEEYYDGLLDEIAAYAFAHTGVANEGDYLLWQFKGYDAGGNLWQEEDGDYLDLQYAVTYYTDAAQEDKVDAKVDEVLTKMDLTDKTDYQKVKSIYDYICANVTYDYDHLNDGAYYLKNTAYGALINGTSVCQGYAVLFYRLALECEIDNRVIAGDTSGGDHGWNIVLLGDEYYNVDSTWDAGRKEYSYFLKCPDNFSDHIRWPEYDMAEFHEIYPMAAEDYSEPSTPDIPVEPENPFVDISESNYYYDAVLWALENGITSGKDATHFAPTDACTRAQVVTFLWRSQGCPKPKTTVNPFVDVPNGKYYTDAVLWAYENGITSGKDETHFQPDVTVTRSQFVTFLWRLEGQPAPTITNPFKDIPSGKYYTNAVLWAFENGITAGKDATHFEPDASCQRCQVVTFLYRAYK